MKNLPVVHARPIDHTWTPSEAVYQVLGQHNIPRAFADDQLPEFIIYWNERGAIEHSWGSKFMKHCIHEFRHHEIRNARAGRDIAMHANWIPSQKARAALRVSGITDQFINDECLDDFILYWTERGDICHTWNSKFVQHVRYRWAHRPAVPGTPHSSIAEQLADRSWAVDYIGGTHGKV